MKIDITMHLREMVLGEKWWHSSSLKLHKHVSSDIMVLK